MKKIVFNLIFLLFIVVSSSAQVAINTDGSAADSSAILDIKSTLKGLLIPRMTALERDNISSPATGLLVYVTDDNTFYCFTGSNWIEVGGSNSPWTKDNSGNVFLTESTDWVGIGTSTPSAPLDVYGRISQTGTGESVFIGEGAGTNDDKSDNENVFVGYQAGNTNTTGYSNTATGTQALFYNNTGNSNTAVGKQALFYNNGYSNTAIGGQAGFQNTGYGNVFIGYQAGYYETGNEKLYISNSSISTPLIGGDFANDSVYLNGTLKLDHKLVTTVGGDTDMKSYIYGSVASDGTVVTTSSSSGFSVTKNGTGEYQINFDDTSINGEYTVTATALNGTDAVVLTIAKDANYFVIYTRELEKSLLSYSFELADNAFDFTAYKK